jgi:hypothetical protein
MVEGALGAGINGWKRKIVDQKGEDRQRDQKERR